MQIHLTLSRTSVMPQVGLPVPTPFAEESGLLRAPSPAPGVYPALALPVTPDRGLPDVFEKEKLSDKISQSLHDKCL